MFKDSIFGNTNNTQPNLFSSQNQQNGGNNLFGSNNTTQAQNIGSNLFGNNNSSNNIFNNQGNNNIFNNSNNQTSFLNSNNNGNSSIFNNNNNNSLFNNNNNQSTLFNNNNNNNQGSLFNNNNNNNNNQGSIFNNNNNNNNIFNNNSTNLFNNNNTNLFNNKNNNTNNIFNNNNNSLFNNQPNTNNQSVFPPSQNQGIQSQNFVSGPSFNQNYFQDENMTVPDLVSAINNQSNDIMFEQVGSYMPFCEDILKLENELNKIAKIQQDAIIRLEQNNKENKTLGDRIEINSNHIQELQSKQSNLQSYISQLQSSLSSFRTLNTAFINSINNIKQEKDLSGPFSSLENYMSFTFSSLKILASELSQYKELLRGLGENYRKLREKDDGENAKISVKILVDEIVAVKEILCMLWKVYAEYKRKMREFREGFERVVWEVGYGEEEIRKIMEEE